MAESEARIALRKRLDRAHAKSGFRVIKSLPVLAVKLIAEEGFTPKQLLDLHFIGRTSLKNAIRAKKRGQRIGVPGRPLRLSMKEEEELANEVLVRLSCGEPTSPSTVAALVCIPLSFTHF